MGVFCGAAGFLTAYQYTTANGDGVPSIWAAIGSMERPTLIAVSVYFACLAAFLKSRYHAVDVIPLEARHEGKLNQIKVAYISIGVTPPILAAILLGAGVDAALVGSFGVILFAAILPMCAILRRMRGFLNAKEKETTDVAYSFPLRIFFPAICTCVISFLLGWTLNEGKNASIIAIVVVSVTLSLMVLATGSSGKSSRRTLLAFSLFLLISPVASRYFSDYSLSIGLLIALFVAFGMGVTEVTNRLSYITEGPTVYYLAATETKEFYQAGANWSAYVFIPFVPMLGLFLPSVPVWLLYMYTLAFLLIWIIADDKTTPRFSKISTALGFLLPVVLIAGLYVGHSFPDAILLFGGGNGRASLSDRITTILGVLLTIIFVLLQSDYQALMKGYRDPKTFLSKKNCMLLFFVVISFVSIYALFVTSILARLIDGEAFLASKVDEFQIWSLILISTMLVFYIWDGDDKGGDEPKSPSEIKSVGVDSGTPTENYTAAPFLLRGSTSRRILRTGRALLSMGRVSVSSISGIVVGALFCAKGFVADEIVFPALSMMSVTMFGFVINDIYDLKKDRLGLRSDKHLVSGDVTVSQAKLFAFGLLLLTWATAWHSFGHSALTYVVTLCIALTVYSPFTRAAPLFKGLYTATLCATPLIFVNFSLGENVIPIYLIFFTVVFFAGRELVIDSGEIDADRRAGLRTLAVVIGRKRGLQIGWLVMLSGFAVLAIESDSVGQLMAICGLLILVGLGFVALYDARMAIRLTRLPLLFGAIAVAFSV